MTGPRTLIRNAALIDPEGRFTGRGDVLFDVRDRPGADDPGGVIVDIGPKIDVGLDTPVIEADGLALAPGLIDMRASIGEPGAEHRETLKSAGRAALAGGVTTLIMQPTTAPVIDDVSLVDYVLRRGAARTKARILPAAALTKGLNGEQMSEIGLLAEAGAVMFTHGDHALSDTRLARRALSYARAFDALVAMRPEDPHLAKGGCMHEGEFASRLGIPGIPAAAELVMAQRDLTLAELTGATLLLDMISTAAVLEPIARAKAKGVAAFASVSVHHLCLNELEAGDYRTFAKLSPPLRSEEDRLALIEALNMGVIDVIVSGHEPRPAEDKRLPFDEAAFGAAALETLLPGALLLHHNGTAQLQDIIRAMTLNPARLLGLPQGRLAAGAPADLILIDLDKPFRFDADQMRSKCRNSPFDGKLLQGQVVRTIVGGETVFQL
jgi:dihydroorotase